MINLNQLNEEFLQAQKRSAKLYSSWVLSPEDRLELRERLLNVHLSIGLAAQVSNVFDDLNNIDPKQLEASVERFTEQLAGFSKFLDELEQKVSALAQ